MAGATITVSVDSERAGRALKLAAQHCKDLRPALKSIGEHMLRSVDRNFAAEGRPMKWRPWSMATIESRRGGRGKTYTKKGQLRAATSRMLTASKILTMSSRLRRSVTYQVQPESVLVGTNVIYAAIHQFGGECGRGKMVRMPARPYLMVQDEDWDAIADIVYSHVLQDMGVST